MSTGDPQSYHSIKKTVVKINLLQPRLQRGEWLAFRYQLDRPGYANVYALNSSGTTMQLIRNQRINTTGWHAFPAAHDTFDLRVGGPVGTERFILIYTSQPFNPLSSYEYKVHSGVSKLTLTTGQLQHRLYVSTQQLRPEDWARADTISRIH